eukprot:TRINITY_DN8486_c0_g2_i1.p1 TRINITY_DN8486_c0_g2~~TRINITY_DN8486_c0_g2_i1.p1  ORF type:complete len:384 (+),score=70.82 TRINITY_DN8486_c0_g2_i1:56-1153(+)
MPVPDGFGFGAACLSAVFNGSFAALSKHPAVAAIRPDPVVFNAYVCVGVFISSWFVVPFYSVADVKGGVKIEYEGIVAGLLLVGAVLFSFVAIPLAGLGLAQTVWSGCAILVAFLWGAVGPDQVSAPLKSTPLSILAIALLLLGICGVVSSERIARFVQQLCCQQHPYEDVESLKTAAERRRSDTNSGCGCDPLETKALSEEQPNATAQRRLLGFISAIVVGLFGGSILAPMSFSDLDGIAFIPSFGVGTGIGGVTVALAHRLCHHVRGQQWTGWHLQTAVLPAGLLSGFVYNLGNLCQVWAQSYVGLAYGVAYPIQQCALVVAGLIGIFIFREVTDKGTIAAFFASSGVIICGAALLGVYGPHN